MRYLDLTLPTPAANLACDEALLEACDRGEQEEILRVWEPPTHFVVLGYANHARDSVDLAACRRARVPVLRRCSGGGTVLQGPGCLNFSLIVQRDGATPFGHLMQTIGYVLSCHQEAVQRFVQAPVEIQGVSDLAIDLRKFSGNASRVRRRAVLFHGTFLLHLDLSLLERLLPVPCHQPAYRGNRPHREFLCNLRLSSAALKTVLRARWGAAQIADEPSHQHIDRLAQSRYTIDV